MNLDALMNHLAQCPEVFLKAPIIAGKGDVRVSAVVYDLAQEHLSRSSAQIVPERLFVESLETADSDQANRLQITLILAWLLYHPAFVLDQRHVLKVITELPSQLAPHVVAPIIVSDPDRREELVRLALARLQLQVSGESTEFAEDRLKSVSIMERKRILKETRAAAEHAAKVRRAMETERAREAAARVSRE